MGKSFLETAFSLSHRILSRSRVEDMTTEEEDFAHITKEVYGEPENRRTTLRGYTLLRTYIPLHETFVPLNDERWAVYRAPNCLDHVLVFRGMKNWEDATDYDCEQNWGFGRQRYMMDATVWAFRVMMFFARRHAEGRGKNQGGDDANLRFWVAGHSLGGSVAMGVILHLQDIPSVAQQLEDDALALTLPFTYYTVYKQEIADPWNVAISLASKTPPYKLCGGHVFNPGAWARSEDAVSAAIVSLVHLFRQHRQGRDGRADRPVTTHHILGDLLSCWHRIGKEKNYLPKKKTALLMSWLPSKRDKAGGPHNMNNFL